ncbi:bifunctional precorrin-2 dehydrogenase/sirohydrochlorin ferrochelatase [Bariatricus massiliensis]|uniref:precorrin-2 dehydrogenase n=1 Tax=Bariatricus massiliensis TaxID=1745713 RepID=A0ABS8DEU6_9FIRM|nr:bifunctional precorrin-2 dehydrogenase/sirohydrochlorin ferrochelatase [Bariatricus massiliensis]MCB7303019.1 bifunctional precorrin-2 dehydrogenase/sirohydrochlorin ferrochelatase [Bariatricus massiliensis]MCB7374235.1 bifunctional precorrin-2 dehydrogenase/sirohydrochlorin ferrochelatase [Bariatricus massiliensis]MCB7386905.1 bifunctional precorrin-2 dehydrogenase/sirohydrochlorin ferrochelatase [Bariatricus massiliensis]MCB7411067.1 bifunctional precorrin-2 dehydrogenase/sirohydrochlorin 
MEKMYFPMFVDLSDKRIVIVGGGNVAARRVETLLRFATDITVVAPQISRRLQELGRAGSIRCAYRAYDRADIREADMVLAATDSGEVNRGVWEDCREEERQSGRRILFNSASDKGMCDFYFPAVVETDGVMIGINSAGRNPAKVKQVRQRIQEEFS